MSEPPSPPMRPVPPDPSNAGDESASQSAPGDSPPTARRDPAPSAALEWDGVRELHPAVLASRLAGGDPLLLIDVRESWEWNAVRLDGATHIPLAGFARAAATLDASAEIVIYCHHGMRSLAAANYLSERGFRRLWNLSGGIDRYAEEQDPSLPRY